MPVMINLTTAEHGGRTACGSCGHATCGISCECGCPYTAMEERGNIELIMEIEQRYPQEWLALVIPPGEDDFTPERAMLVVHSADDEEVWQAVKRITHNQVVHIYFNGALDTYIEWANSEPSSPRKPTVPIVPLLSV